MDDSVRRRSAAILHVQKQYTHSCCFRYPHRPACRLPSLYHGAVPSPESSPTPVIPDRLPYRWAAQYYSLDLPLPPVTSESRLPWSPNPDPSAAPSHRSIGRPDQRLPLFRPPFADIPSIVDAAAGTWPCRECNRRILPSSVRRVDFQSRQPSSLPGGRLRGDSTTCLRLGRDTPVEAASIPPLGRCCDVN